MAVTYFNVTGNYSSFAPGLVLRGNVLFTPVLREGDIAKGSGLTPPTGFVPVPVHGKVVNGHVQAVGGSTLQLQSGTSDLNLTTPLYYAVTFSNMTATAFNPTISTVTSSTEPFLLNSFAFLAPTDATAVNLITVSPAPGVTNAVGSVSQVPASGISDANAFTRGFLTSVTDQVSAQAYIGAGAGSGLEWEEYANLAAFPVTGDVAKEYVAKDTGKIYRWTGSAYFTTALTKADVGLGNVDNTADAAKTVASAGSATTATRLATPRNIAGVAFDGSADIALTKTNVGLGNVDNTSDVNKPMTTATLSALKWVARNPGAHLIPAARISYFDKANTAYASLPTAMDTGQALIYAQAGGSTNGQSTIASGALRLPRGIGGHTASATYVGLDAGSGHTVSRIGAKFNFDITGATTAGAAIALAMTNDTIANTGLTSFRIGAHLEVDTASWTLSTVSNATGTAVFTTINNGALKNVLEFDPTLEYTVEMWRVGNTVTIILPDGQKVTATDANIGAWSGRYGFYENFMLFQDTDVLPGLTEAWYDLDTQYFPGSTGLVNRDDLNSLPLGIVRSVSTLTMTATIGAAALTDYVIYLGAGAVPALPTAVGNTNRYTFKNIDVASKTVSTTSSQTVDGSTTLTIGVNAAFDLVSDGANWRIV